MVLQDLRSVLSTVQFCPGRLAQHVDVGKHPPLQLKAFNLPWLEARLKCSASAKPHGHFFAAGGRKWQLSIPDTASAWGWFFFFLLVFFFFTCFQRQSNRWLSTIWIIRSTLKDGCCSSALLPNMRTSFSPLQLTGWWNRGARGLLFVKV